MILVTGCAGFIGYFVCQLLLKEGKHVVGIDNLNSYYDVNLKKSRLDLLKKDKNFKFQLCDIADQKEMESLFQSYQFESVIHLAAQAGVRHSLVDPMSYVHSNLIGFCILLECCRHHKFLKHLVYASTSSVYGMNTELPFHEGLVTDTPMSLYAATKQANESLAQSYYHLYKIPMTGLRFFTVYGPWGRPDMALFKFTKAILENQPIEIFNQGQMVRDWTYVEDVAQAVLCAIEHIPNLSQINHKIYNIGRGSPESLAKAIEYLEEALSKKTEKIYLPLQKGDVVETQANIDKAKKELGYNPKTSLKEGIQNFVDWYKNFYKNQ